MDTEGGSQQRSVEPLVRVRGLSKTYYLGEAVAALRGVNLEIAAGEFVALVGASGSGKSTLLNILGCLDRPSAGEYWLAGHAMSTRTADELASMRNQLLGFVFQSFHLLPRLTALENVQLPLTYDQRHQVQSQAKAVAALVRLGLGERLNHKPMQLSGGQQQRVAIARALVNTPALLLADEPTGNLDSNTAKEILRVFSELNAAGTTILMITHDAVVAAHAQRRVEIKDGVIVTDGTQR